MQLFETLRCYGYHGFGSGFEMASTGQPGSKPDDKSAVDAGGLYCSRVCPMGQTCWDVHRRRVASMFPDISARFAEMAKAVQGPDLVRRWWETYRTAPPVVTVMTGNLEDGASVALGAAPADRGDSTLTWPLTSLPPSVLDG